MSYPVRLADRRAAHKPTAAEVSVEIARSIALSRFVRFGFTFDQAMALARADYHLTFLPAAAVAL